MSVAPPRVGIILTGGGARAAYQVGVLRAIAELVPREAGNPFPIISGTSAGAINAVALAADAVNFRRAVLRLQQQVAARGAGGDLCRLRRGLARLCGRRGHRGVLAWDLRQQDQGHRLQLRGGRGKRVA